MPPGRRPDLGPGQIFNHLGLDPYHIATTVDDDMHQMLRTLKLLLHPDRRDASPEAARAQSHQQQLLVDFVTLRQIEDWLRPAYNHIMALLEVEARAIVHQRAPWVSTWNPHRLEDGALLEPLPSWTRRNKSSSSSSSSSSSQARRYSQLDLRRLPLNNVSGNGPKFDGSDCRWLLEDGEETQQLMELAEAMHPSSRVCVAIAFLKCGTKRGCTAIAELPPDSNNRFLVHIRDSRNRLIITITLSQLLMGLHHTPPFKYVNFQGIFRMVEAGAIEEYIGRFLESVDEASRIILHHHHPPFVHFHHQCGYSRLVSLHPVDGSGAFSASSHGIHPAPTILYLDPASYPSSISHFAATMNTTMQNPSTPPPPLSEQNNDLVLSLETQRLVSQAHNLVTIADARRSSGRQYKGLDPHGHTAGIVDMLALLDPRGAYRRPANMATPEARVLRNHTQRARKIHCELQKVVDQFCRDGLLRTPGSNSDNHDNTEDESADNDNRFDLNEDEQASGDEHQQVRRVH
ncbi:hypothetical protein IWX48DRAFT_595669 [Phyllosticta citricarpa]